MLSRRATLHSRSSHAALFEDSGPAAHRAVRRVAQERESTARAPSAPLSHREPASPSQTASPHRGLFGPSGPPEWFVSRSGDRGDRAVALLSSTGRTSPRSPRCAARPLFKSFLAYFFVTNKEVGRLPGANSRRGRATQQEHTRPAGRCLSRRELSGQQWAFAGMTDEWRGGQHSGQQWAQAGNPVFIERRGLWFSTRRC